VTDQRTDEVAGRLHGVAVRLLRMVRREDRETGISGPRLSALSVLVFGGPTSLAGLAAAEQVSAPTMSRVVEGLARAGLVTREPEPGNRRRVRIAATEAGTKLLEEGRRRRVRALSTRLARFADSERRALERAVELLERAVR
jgi:DNA-binding MarR family transcriptional regulator